MSSRSKVVDEQFDLQSETGRQKAVEALFPYVRGIARQIYRHLPPWLDCEDLLQAGVLGHYSAMRSYDASRKVSFRLFAAFRVRGAILDYLRAQDILSRDARRRLRRAEAENQPHTDINVEELPAGEDPDQLALPTQAETRDHIRQAMQSLRPNQRRVVELYYFGDLTMREIAKAHPGVNESRVSQTHSAAIHKLRSVMAPPISDR